MKNVFAVLFSIFLLTAMCSCTSMPKREPWTFTDQTLFTAAAALHGADWLHTRAGIGKYGFEESNVILGKTPSTMTIDLYFASTAIGLTAVAWYTPKKFRRGMLIGWAVIELVSVMHNQTIGVQLSF